MIWVGDFDYSGLIINFILDIDINLGMDYCNDNRTRHAYECRMTFKRNPAGLLFLEVKNASLS